MTRVAAVVLAAGAATRFGAPKQLLLLPAVLERLARSELVDEVVLVQGAYDLGDMASRADVQIALCADWARGPGASLRCGLEALADDVDAAVVVLADGPMLAPSAIDRVVSSWQEDGGAVVAASYGGVRGHPLLVARRAWAGVPDEGLRTTSARLVPCDDLGEPGDIDTPEDLRELEELDER